jgi:hypothetical protein
MPNYLLQEDGGFLLQENGAKIILDTTVQRGFTEMRSQQDQYPFAMEDERVL